MSPIKTAVKGLFSAAGLNVSRRDPLEEQIPGDYLRSPYLPRVYRQSLGRLFNFRAMFERVRGVPGDIVECGVSTGHGILYFSLLCELSTTDRRIVGFDSFEGFPPSVEQDRKADTSFQTAGGDYASAPELVLRVLKDGRVSDDFVRKNVQLVRGFFDKTLPSYAGPIALLHLDCDLYESYHTCLAALYPKMAPGGVLMFDEYEDPNFPGGKQAVDEFFADKPEKAEQYLEYGYEKWFVVKR